METQMMWKWNPFKIPARHGDGQGDRVLYNQTKPNNLRLLDNKTNMRGWVTECNY